MRRAWLERATYGSECAITNAELHGDWLRRRCGLLYPANVTQKNDFDIYFGGVSATVVDVPAATPPRNWCLRWERIAKPTCLTAIILGESLRHWPSRAVIYNSSGANELMRGTRK
jgi:hypothetical protein